MSLALPRHTSLIDYDPTANYGNWQYVAGTGNDPRASRQFNPIKQARDYDPTGEYVRTWIPQLKDLPISKIHTPWLMSEADWSRYCPDDTRFKRAMADSMSSPASATASLSSAKNRLAPLNKDNMDAQVNAAKAIGLRPPTSSSSSSLRKPAPEAPTPERKESFSGGSSNDDLTPSLSNSSARSAHPIDATKRHHHQIHHDYFSSHSSSSANSHSENDPEDDEGQSSSSSNVRSSFRSFNESDRPATSASTSQPSPEADSQQGDVRKRDTQQIIDSNDLSVPNPKAALEHATATVASNDYSAGMPYPRKPLFEQPSWKAHYFRKDLGRRKGGAGGGDSRRLIRPPKLHAPT